ncbi:MAG: hypothetical protein J6W41_01030 [Alphaproteobacteria bacterium]|nr:hypothetical protein [Alphaproteobacteria bacterium]
MLLKHILFLCLLTLPMYVGAACAADDGFEFMDDAYSGYDDGADAFMDSNNTDITYSDSGDDNEFITDSGNTTLNDGASLINVANFDIAGIMLGMNFEDVYNLYHEHNNLYAPRKRNSLVYTIPTDWKYNLDYECRQSGVVQPNKLEKCIRSLAQNRGLLYVSEIHLERVKTGEKIDVFLTSNATDNVVYRIVYSNDVEKLEGNNPKFADQRDKRRLAFWKNVVAKYGTPNSGVDTWITSTNSYDPKMTAYYDSLDLMNLGQQATDIAAAAEQSRENFRAKPYAF